MWLVNLVLGLFRRKKCSCKGKQACKTTLIVSTLNSSNTAYVNSQCDESIKITGVNQNLYYVWLGNKVVVTFKPLKNQKVTRGVLAKSIIPHKIIVESFRIFD